VRGRPLTCRRARQVIPTVTKLCDHIGVSSAAVGFIIGCSDVATIPGTLGARPPAPARPRRTAPRAGLPPPALSQAARRAAGAAQATRSGPGTASRRRCWQARSRAWSATWPTPSRTTRARSGCGCWRAWSRAWVRARPQGGITRGYACGIGPRACPYVGAGPGQYAHGPRSTGPPVCSGEPLCVRGGCAGRAWVCSRRPLH